MLQFLVVSILIARVCVLGIHPRRVLTLTGRRLGRQPSTAFY